MGSYRLEARLGVGGMAEVMLATLTSDGGFERKVAVKRLLPHLASDPSSVRMFLDEARIASRLHHGSIVSVIDYGLLDGAPFQVLELIDGSNLHKLCSDARARGRDLPLSVALHVGYEVAQALAYAHELKEGGRALGIVHRDVSPSNILVGWNGDVKLSDFGIAFANDRLERTSAGVMKGKLAYMAPEQALGAGVDGRADVFSLGCTLHALLTGRSPIGDEQSLSRVLSGQPLELDAALEDDVAAIVLRATAPSRGDRYPSMRELARALADAYGRREQRPGRELLLAWLDRVRERDVAPPSALEVMLGLHLVPGSDDTNEVSTYVSKPIAAPRPEGSASVGLATEPPQQRPEAPKPFPQDGATTGSGSTTRRWLTLAATLALALAMVAAWWAWPSDAATEHGPSSIPDLPRSAAATASAKSAPRPPDTLAAGESARSVAPSASLREPTASASARGLPSARTGSTSAVIPAPTASPEPPPAPPVGVTQGYLIVAGERVHGFTVSVDGRPVGAAPTPALALSLGAHTVKLSKGGETLGPYSITLTEQHASATKALRFRP